jgi:hypothetical protein
MSAWTATVINKHGFETDLTFLGIDGGVMEGGAEIELGRHQGRDYPRGGRMSPEQIDSLIEWLLRLRRRPVSK